VYLIFKIKHKEYNLQSDRMITNSLTQNPLKQLFQNYFSWQLK